MPRARSITRTESSTSFNATPVIQDSGFTPRDASQGHAILLDLFNAKNAEVRGNRENRRALVAFCAGAADSERSASGPIEQLEGLLEIRTRGSVVWTQRDGGAEVRQRISETSELSEEDAEIVVRLE